MSKVFFDIFTYRWKKMEGSYYFGKNPTSPTPPFEKAEKEFYLNQLINSLLLHEKIVVKLDSLEELELLIGINNLMKLFNNNLIEIIDDKGTMVGFMIVSNKRNMLMNFSDCTTLQLPAIEKRLTKKLKGKIENRILQPFLLNVEKNKLEIDGAWFGHLLEQELYYDFNNKNLTNLLDIQSESSVRILDRDTLSVMRLYYLNRSLIYQNEIGADFVLTEEYSKNILQTKISPILHREINPEIIFEKILFDKGIPQLASLVLDDVIKFEHILELRNNIDGVKFRKWLREKDYDKKLIYEELLKFNPSIASNSWVKMIRWISPNLVGFSTPILGIAASAVDSFILDKLLKGWHPNFFLDEKLKKHIDSEIEKDKKNKDEIRIQNRLGKKIGRNEICPCGSNKKFKHCCGK